MELDSSSVFYESVQQVVIGFSITVAENNSGKRRRQATARTWESIAELESAKYRSHSDSQRPLTLILEVETERRKLRIAIKIRALRNSD